MLAVTAKPAFSACDGMLSIPAALPPFICLMSMLISSIVGGSISIGRSVGAASKFGGFSVTGRLKNSLKCFTHLFHCSSMLVITLPSLHFASRSGLRINATPCVCGAFSPSRPECNSSSPEASRCCPT
ncbi:unnamed protein product [Schistosoma curassoni]|uniref:Secreted protein n=1 Tax=Schistosoma curassoni TaxID=6186 RepID=A0A183L575_9TREM|nr:unnamed protein product [Schistosoma curassoni]